MRQMWGVVFRILTSVYAVGSEACAKNYGRGKRSLTQIFGWETDAAGDEYGEFLDQFLPSLVCFIKEHDLEKRSYFHVSDEPYLDHVSGYSRASERLARHLSGFPIIDALSNYEFYEKGIIKNPITPIDHIEPFLENGVRNLWTYYCCAQYKSVANRFFCFPSSRNRIIGMQMFKYQIAGFLHWGYNFWYSQYSLRAIDPYRTTDADVAFPSGDAFAVYPGANGQPIESIRLAVFYEALQDMRALQLLEELIGREETLKMLEENLEQELTFRNFPTDADWLLACKEKMNRKIVEALRHQSVSK